MLKNKTRTRMDGVGVLVGNLDAEFLFNGHDNFDGVEGVEAEVVGEMGDWLDLYGCVGYLQRSPERETVSSWSCGDVAYVGSVVDLQNTGLAPSRIFLPSISGVKLRRGCDKRSEVFGRTYLVETLQQAHDSALYLLLLQTAGGAVHSDAQELG